MRNIIKLSVITLFLFQSGCAALDAYQAVTSTILSPTDLDVAVIEHNKHYNRANNSMGTLYVAWKTEQLNAKHSMSGIYIYVNGEPVSAVTYNTYTAIELMPGSYKIAVGDSDNQDETKTILIKENQDIYYSTGVTLNFTVPDSLFLIENHEPIQAKKNISKLIYVTLKL